MVTTQRKKILHSIQFSYATSTISMTFVLFLLGAIGFIMSTLFHTTKSMRESVTMVVELSNDLSEQDRDRLETFLSEHEMVRSLTYVTKEEKLEDEGFKRVFDVNIKGVISVNPLPNTYDVILSEHSANKRLLEEFVEKVRNTKGVELVNYPQELLEEMHTTLDLFQLVLAIFGSVVLVISLILLNNTIRLVVYARRELINTLKAVGATKWFIMRPFIGRSALQGCVAGILSALLLCLTLYGINKIAPGFGLFPTSKWLMILCGAMVVMGVIVAILSTLPVVNRFVNMKSNKIHLC